MEPTPLSPEQRREILDQIHQREFLEREALAQEKLARKQEAERQQREALALEARRVEQERKQRLTDNLTTCLRLIQQALETFQEGNEPQTYVLLVKADPFFTTVKHQVNQVPERPSGTGLPTLKVKADSSPLGYAIINAEEFIEGIHQLYEEGAN